MRFRYAAQQGLKPGSDMTPMIDIVFNLLLFFLLSSSYVQHTALEVRLPEATSAPSIEGEAVVVELTRDDRLFFQSKEVTLEELRAGMREAYPEKGSTRPLLIRADAQAFHGRVVALLDIARDLGVSSLNVATIPATDRR
jgi:biopolymer transport protein ExbD